MELTYDLIAKRIDHSLLSPTMMTAELEAGCRLAARYGVASVCIKPFAVPLAKRWLAGTGVAVGTTIGFPHGANSPAVKAFEARQALSDGATELDMVINIGQALGGEWKAVGDDIEAVCEVAHKGGAIVKVIFENCYLDDAQKSHLSQLAGRLRVDFIKTSTGYGTGGATHADLQLMRKDASPKVKLKAAGGVRDLDEAIKVIVEYACDRVGASRTAEILETLKARLAGKAVPETAVPRETGGY